MQLIIPARTVGVLLTMADKFLNRAANVGLKVIVLKVPIAGK